MSHYVDKDYWTLLIVDKLTGAITEEGDRELQGWLVSSEQHRMYYKEVRQTWEFILILDEKKQFEKNKDKAYQFFRKRTNAKRKRTYTFLRYVAVIIPFILLGYTSYLLYSSTGTLQGHVFSEIYVPKGSKMQLTLQDGTKIWLNAESHLSFNKDFGKKERRIQLSGEAHLDVVKNKDLPFVVEAGVMSVKVLGTRFNVNAYAENENIKVALEEGAIELFTQTTVPTRLKPNDLALYNTSTGSLTVENKPDLQVSWTEGKLEFKEETFEEIIRTLERKFNIQVIIKDPSIRKRRFIGDFKKNE